MNEKECYYCGCILVRFNRSIDHKLPKSKYKHLANEKTNLVDACKGCNNVKRDMTEEEFKKTKYYQFNCTGRWKGYKPRV